MSLYINTDNIIRLWRQFVNHISGCLDSYILPEYRIRIAAIYVTAITLLTLRILTGRPILETVFKLLLKNQHIRSFVYVERGPSSFLNVSYSIVSHVFPLLFPFLITFLFAIFTPNTETRVIY